jgi:photosystem II stability/assembly factor-like uncharacterized protein
MKKINWKFILILLILSVSVNAQWVSSNLPLSGIIRNINYVDKNDIYVNQSYTYFPFPQTSATTVRLFKSNNSGASWYDIFSYAGQMYQSLGMSNVSFLNPLKGIFGFSQSTSSYIYKTTNAGANWTSTVIPYSGFSPAKCNYLNDSTYVVLTTTGGPNYQVFRSTNSGISWSFSSLPVSGYMNNMYFLNQNTGFIVTSDGNILKSVNSGSTWDVINTGVLSNIMDISFLNSSTGFAVGIISLTSSVIFKSTNEGNNWSVIDTITTGQLNSISCQNPSVVYVSGVNRVIKSIDSGDNWTEILIFQDEGSAYISCYNKDTLAVSKLNSVYRSYNGGTYVKVNSNIIPDKYSLLQNYPNPFNPTTTIKFDILRLGDVKIVVYDIMGREVQTLANEKLQPGTYQATFDGSKLTSGVYFYRLTSDNFTDTKRMLLVK